MRIFGLRSFSKVLLHIFLTCGVALVLAAPTFEVEGSESLLAPDGGTCFREQHRRDVHKKQNIHPHRYSNFVEYIEADDIESLLLSPAAFMTSADQQNPFSFYNPTAHEQQSITESVTTTTVIKEEPTTVTVSGMPTTITETVTLTAFFTSSTSETWRTASSPLSGSPPIQGDPGNRPIKTTWAAPATMTDLSSFQVSKFAGGEKNFKIISSIPSEASGISTADTKISDGADVGSAMQVLYPANSIDPASKPQGGAEFYASPIDISDAQNVTLQYSVFFPKNFNWVLAGKLPGLYGGHTGCSGGNAALDCFSTRLMWRQNGVGELYLYAPKDKQTQALCSDPQSVCDETYGLSVGRGSFHWKAGSWVTVQQTVVLNTPGNQDGHFTLYADGQKAIYRDDVFYREDSTAVKHSKKSVRPTKTTTKKHERMKTAPTATSTDNGDVLGPILSGIIGGLRRRDVMTTASCETTEGVIQPTSTNSRQLVENRFSQVTSKTSEADEFIDTGPVKENEVKFAGIFFSTFFGGHEPQYATPEDQYVWFKDFALSYNS